MRKAHRELSVWKQEAVARQPLFMFGRMVYKNSKIGGMIHKNSQEMMGFQFVMAEMIGFQFVMVISR